MNARLFFREENFLWEAVMASVLVHLLLFSAGTLSIRFPSRHTVEIDITNMGHLGAPIGAKPASAPPPVKPAPKPKEWVRPKREKPAPIPIKPAAPEPEQPPPQPPSSSNSGAGAGTGEGEGLAGLSRLPQLLNLGDLRTILKKLYPESERALGHEGTVVVDLHVDENGSVTSAEVVKSAGADFDAAAVSAAKLLRFSPAFKGSEKVAVKLRQAIQFKIEDE